MDGSSHDLCSTNCDLNLIKILWNSDLVQFFETNNETYLAFILFTIHLNQVSLILSCICYSLLGEFQAKEICHEVCGRFTLVYPTRQGQFVFVWPRIELKSHLACFA